jgi:hypothetical protein
VKNVSDNEKGLYNKYTVINNETGKPIEGEAFILRPDKDDMALIALEAYAEATENQSLKQDIKEWVRYLKFERGQHTSTYEMK